MKILVTGFDPFGGEEVNPAIETVKRLPETIAGRAQGALSDEDADEGI